jgi:alkylation response protein AidB-like acyl-CoA dehydrogenase
MTDLLYSEEEEALRAAVRDLLADHCDAPGVIARVETDTPHNLALWKALTDGMGLAGLLVPEELDGQGATHREAAVGSSRDSSGPDWQPSGSADWRNPRRMPRSRRPTAAT